MKTIGLILIILFHLNSDNVGMYYSIEADRETSCNGDFPTGLSYFFEQVGGYEDKSMVSQIEQHLDIDLKIFQEYDFPENEEPARKYWKDINVFEKTVNIFVAKIKAQPQYYKKIKFHPLTPEYGFSSDPQENKRMQEKQKEYEEHPMFGYPNDTGYLSSGQLLEDLQAFQEILRCYKSQGVKKVKLFYQ